MTEEKCLLCWRCTHCVLCLF